MSLARTLQRLDLLGGQAGGLDDGFSRESRRLQVPSYSQALFLHALLLPLSSSIGNLVLYVLGGCHIVDVPLFVLRCKFSNFRGFKQQSEQFRLQLRRFGQEPMLPA